MFHTNFIQSTQQQQECKLQKQLRGKKAVTDAEDSTCFFSVCAQMKALRNKRKTKRLGLAVLVGARLEFGALPQAATADAFFLLVHKPHKNLTILQYLQ